MGNGENVRLRFTKKLYKLFIKELPPIFKMSKQILCHSDPLIFAEITINIFEVCIIEGG